MDVYITNWALQDYLEHKHKKVFSSEEYKDRLRPEAELLKQFPNHPKFDDGKFWGPGRDRSGKIVTNGYKLKWHNVGSGNVQLRVLVVMFDGDAYICDAYVKKDDKVDARKMAILKNRVKAIFSRNVVTRGTL